jgi:hypothetical protein
MSKLIAAALAVTLLSSAQAMPIVPPQPPDDSVIAVREACGPGRVRVNGVCVARTTIRHTRREVRRCLRWEAGVCARYE